MAKEGLHQALNRLLRENAALSQQVAERDAAIADLKVRNHKLWCEECNATMRGGMWEAYTRELLRIAGSTAAAARVVQAARMDTDMTVAALVDVAGKLDSTVKKIEARHPELKANTP